MEACVRLIAAALAASATGCVTPPPVPVVPSWLDGGEEVRVDEREVALRDEAQELVSELLADDEIVVDAPLDAFLAEVLARITPPLAPLAPTPRAVVVASTERNASALPDGTILVSTGLLAVLENEAQLVALLGHELAHVLFRHGRARQVYAEQTRSYVDRMTLSKQQESQADDHALHTLVRFGYDAAQILGMLDRVDTEPGVPAASRIRAWESHPDMDARFGRLVRLLRKTPNAGEQRVGVEAYETAIRGILPLAVEHQIEAGDAKGAAETLERLLALEPRSGRAYYLKAEIARRVEPEGRRSSAVRDAYERAVALDPQDAKALRALGLLLRESGDDTRARDLLARYLEAAPDAVDRSVVERYLSAE